MTVKPQGFSKVAVALGGFLIMMGILLVSLTLLFSVSGFVIEPEYGTLFWAVLLVVSLCDIIVGVILLYR